LFLQIPAKQIIVSSNGDMIGHELHSPFTYLTRLVAELCEEPHKSGSDLVRLGVFENGEPPTMPVERFFSMLRFEQRNRLAEIPIDLKNDKP